MLKFHRAHWRALAIGADRRSVAAMEFALVAPVLVVLFFAVYDITDAMITYEEVFNTAHDIAASASNLSVQGSDSSTKLYYGQVQLEASAIFAEMPTLRTGFHHGIKSITISSVNFEVTPANSTCTPGVSPYCSYAAYVVWSAAYAGPPAGNITVTPALRSCATEAANAQGAETLVATSALTQVGPTGGAPSNLTTIRTSNITTPDKYAAPPDPIIVVDVHYQYVPVFNMFVKTPIDFWANAYWPLRSVQATVLNPNTGTFSPVASDQQFTGLVSTGTTTNGTLTGPYTINGNNVYPSGATAAAPPAADYCISSYYLEPQA